MNNIKSILLIAVLAISNIVIGQKQNKTKSPTPKSVSYDKEVKQRTFYVKKPILAELGYFTSVDFGESLDNAIDNGNLTEIVGMAIQLHFYEECADKRSNHLNSSDILNIAIELAKERKYDSNNTSDLMLIKNAAEKIKDNSALSVITKFNSEVASMAFAEEEWVWTKIQLTNCYYQNVKISIDGFVQPGFVAPGRTGYFKAKSGTHQIKVVGYNGWTYLNKTDYISTGEIGYIIGGCY